MTMVNRQGRDGGKRAAGRGDSRPGRTGKTQGKGAGAGGSGPKADADVADLLDMSSSFDSGVFPAVASPDQADALLDVMVGRSGDDPQEALLTHLRMSFTDPERYSTLARPAGQS